jgi:hypothetical protein
MACGTKVLAMTPSFGSKLFLLLVQKKNFLEESNFLVTKVENRLYKRETSCS